MMTSGRESELVLAALVAQAAGKGQCQTHQHPWAMGPYQLLTERQLHSDRMRRMHRMMMWRTYWLSLGMQTMFCKMTIHLNQLTQKNWQWHLGKILWTHSILWPTVQQHHRSWGRSFA